MAASGPVFQGRRHRADILLDAQGWATIEILKLTTSYLVSPAYYASNIFWRALGYGSSSSAASDSRALMNSIHRQSVLIVGSPTAARPLDVAGVAAHPVIAVPSLPEDASLSNHNKSPSPNRPHDGPEVATPPSSPESRRPPSNHTAEESSSESEWTETAYSESSSSSPSHSPFPSPSRPKSIASLDLDGRPLSTILSQFSHRLTACISSFELVDEDLVFLMTGENTSSKAAVAVPEEWTMVAAEVSQAVAVPETDLPEPAAPATRSRASSISPTPSLDSALSTAHLREPSVAEVRAQKLMEDEVKAVEKIIAEAIDKGRVQDSIFVEQGNSYFQTMQPSFVDVAVSHEGIETEEFLRATECLLKMFEQFASTAFALVQGDIVENIRRVRVRSKAFPFESSTLERLVLSESRERRKLATEGLLWLYRGLKFTAMALRRNLETEGEELSESFTVAWKREYSKYFNFLVRPFFGILVKACPTRAVFYQKLGSPKDKVERDMGRWLEALEGQVEKLERFYAAGKHDKGF